MAIPAGRYPITPDLVNSNLTGTTTIANPLLVTSLPGPFESNATAAAGGVASNQIYHDANKHLHVRTV